MKQDRPSNIRPIEGDSYISLVSAKGHLIHERADALRWDAERDVIEARYGYAIRQLRKARAKRVLDMACGLGYGTWLLNRAGFNVTGVDFSADGLAIARARYPWIKFEQADILSYEYKPVDGIVACEILEHIEDGRDFLRHMDRLLAPRGVLVITTPNIRYSTRANIYHVHEYSLDEISVLLPGTPVRTLVTKLFKPARLWIAIMGEERYMRFNYRISRLFPFHQLPKYAHTFAICVRKPSVTRALEMA